ncbi:MAG: cytidine deaminase [Bacteroidales bacterium]
MQSKEILVPYDEFTGSETLDPGVARLIRKAELAADHAYAPYSGFHVGVTIELTDGQVFTANNQENSAYPSGLCAERVGLFFVQANYPETAIKRLILVAKQNGRLTDEPVYPCGACRQVMVESVKRQTVPFEIWMVGRDRLLRVDSPDYLLPLKFIL